MFVQSFVSFLEAELSHLRSDNSRFPLHEWLSRAPLVERSINRWRSTRSCGLNTCENFIWESKSGKHKVRVWVKIWNPYSQVSIVKQVPSFAKHCTKVSALSVLSADCCICIISRLLYLYHQSDLLLGFRLRGARDHLKHICMPWNN